jgi:NAD(P)-dependent dehydrogenase (short-subunit alcohol dehydrogenase family)
MNIHSDPGSRSTIMSWTTSDIPDQTGRTAVVTGANGGLGLETAKALAVAGAVVVMAARNQDKAAAAADQIRVLAPGATLEVVPLDLGSLDSVHAAAEQISAAHPTIDLLVNNAGVMGIPEQATADGFEMQFGTNHLGHYALTALLLPAVLRADAPRVVTVTSTARHMGRGVRADNPHLHGSYGEWKAYGQSKLANYHFALGLQRRFEAAGARAASLTAHPGLSNTDLQAVSVEQTGGGLSQKFFHSMAGATGMSPARGALPQLRATTDPRAKGGELYAPRWVTNGAPVRRPVLRRIGLSSSIATLWVVSERETGITLDVADALALSRA